MTQPEYDDLWPGGPRFVRSGAGFALGTDSVLLADCAAQRRARRQSLQTNLRKILDTTSFGQVHAGIALRQQELHTGEITGEEYVEWKRNWLRTCDDSQGFDNYVPCRKNK